MFAEVCSVGPGRVAGFKAEEVTTDEVVPLDNLLEVIFVVSVSVRVHQASQWITTKISAVWIHLPSEIVRC